MNNRVISIIFCGIVGCLSFHSSVQAQHEASNVRKFLELGEFSVMNHLIDSLSLIKKVDHSTKLVFDSCQDQSHRILCDFSLDEKHVDAQLNKAYPNFTNRQREEWERSGKLEYRVIDGKKCYFNRSVSNLQLILARDQKKKINGLIPDELTRFRMGHTQTVISDSAKDRQVQHPVQLKVHYEIVVKPDVVPSGETIRCWMPYPKEGHSRQTGVKLTSSFPVSGRIAPDSVGQRSIYFEQKAISGKPTRFEIAFSYTSNAQYFDPARIVAKPYDTTSPIYKRYTRQEPPQVVFNETIVSLAKNIVGKSTNPVEQVNKLYSWIDSTIIWSGALEYSIMPYIPGYVLEHKRGDCGMQTLLFISMARSLGIPVKWQSGWMMHPNQINLHDWCEVYYEGVGWVPVDVSFGLQPTDDRKLKTFYCSGIDAYRLIINDEISSTFIPVKRYTRSEPYDFQRGEVEWKGGNLYFNHWNYHMKVEYLN